MSRLLFEFTESAIKKLIIKFTKDNPELNEDEIREYLDKFDRFKRTIEIKDPFQYKSFNDLKIAVDNAEQKRDAKRGKPIGSSDYVDNEDIIADDENVTIYMGDTKEKCIKYGKGEKYGFCIATPTGNNAFYTYYKEGNKIIFYFIYFKKRIGKRDEILVLGIFEDGNVEETYADNQTGVVNGGMEEIYRKYPELLRYRSLLVFRDTGKAKDGIIIADLIYKFRNYYMGLLSETEKSEILDLYNKSSYEQKLGFLQGFDLSLDKDIFKLFDKRLRNAYITNGPNLNDDIYNLLTESEKKRYTHERRKLYDRYSKGLFRYYSNEQHEEMEIFVDDNMLLFNIRDKEHIKDIIAIHNDFAKNNLFYNENKSLDLYALLIDEIPYSNLVTEIKINKCLFLEECKLPEKLEVLDIYDSKNISKIKGLKQITKGFFYSGHDQKLKLKDILNLKLNMEGIESFVYHNTKNNETIKNLIGLPKRMNKGNIHISCSNKDVTLDQLNGLTLQGVGAININGTVLKTKYHYNYNISGDMLLYNYIKSKGIDPIDYAVMNESFKQFYYRLYG